MPCNGDYLRDVLPYQLGNTHPRYWGWVTGCGTVMGMLAEMLASREPMQ